MGAVLYSQVGPTLLADPTTGDPTRIPGQIVTGIGFLGAGAIIHLGRTVKGLTSAAVIWFRWTHHCRRHPPRRVGS